LDYAELAKFGVAGISAGLIYVLVTVINNNFKERTKYADTLDKLSDAIDRINGTVNSLDEYIRIRNGIGDKTTKALAHALEKLGVQHG